MKPDPPVRLVKGGKLSFPLLPLHQCHAVTPECHACSVTGQRDMGLRDVCKGGLRAFCTRQGSGQLRPQPDVLLLKCFSFHRPSLRNERGTVRGGPVPLVTTPS